jgi:hypothetical protein
MTDNSYLLQYFLEHSPKDSKPASASNASKDEDNKEGNNHE